MQQEPIPSQSHLCHRFNTLIWSFLDTELHRSAIFYAERYFVLDTTHHDARHLYATALLRSGQPHSAYALVNQAACLRCSGCMEVKYRCCTALGRHRAAREALEESLKDPAYIHNASRNSRTANSFPERAVIHCRSGNMALKGNLSENAVASFRQALNLNPMLWEAFEGLCAIGEVPEIDELFPPRPLPVKQSPAEDSQVKAAPAASGAGFFTPESGSGDNSFRWKPDTKAPYPFRIEPLGNIRDSIATVDSSFNAENSFIQGPIRTSRSQPAHLAVKAPAVRPLSSADEAGPVTKKQRSHARQRTAPPSTTTTTAPTLAGVVGAGASAGADTKMKPSKSAGSLLLGADDRSKSSKARARPALTIANIFSSSGRHAQTAATSSRSHTANPAGGGGVGKSNREQHAAASGTGATRRSSRLLGGTGTTKPLVSKYPHGAIRDRRRAVARTRSRSMEDEMEEEPGAGAVEPTIQSPPPIPRSSSSETSPTPSPWTAAHEQAAQEAYDAELADYHIYELMRKFARATRAMALYDCRKCLEELEELPTNHQRSTLVLAMVGKAHYELGEYKSAERAFEVVRKLEPFRLWDMEVYSTLLWHLQQNVKLSFLAQELLAIDPRSPQAWIAVGNCFSLQKERAQALTCFRRAAQLDPTCAYAYTLSGHESIDEDLDKAINFFQTALRADARHYNAWYGLGTCYMRMSKIRLADYHYRKAVKIHPQNAVLLGCVGMVSERYGDRDKALELFNEAVRLSPDNALVRYRRAKILISLKRYTMAVEDLEQLRDTTPDESNVIFQLAKVYRLMGDGVKSATLLAVARDVSPKSVNKIRKLLETEKDTEAGDEAMDEG